MNFEDNCNVCLLEVDSELRTIYLGYSQSVP
jgi:hypothetical protein